MKTEHLEHNTLQYIIRYPDGYVEGEKYPVLIYLHGAGGRGRDIQVIKDHPVFSITAQHEKFPFICVAPQCYANSWFDIFEKLQDFALYIYNSDFCDKRRVYLMGASMGGYGTWQLAMSRPELFAAIVPICGGGMYWNAPRLKNVPVWAFHGACDPAVLPRESEIMVHRVKMGGGTAKLTLYEGGGHNAWTETFQNKEVFEWLLSNVKDSVEVGEDKYNNTKEFG